MTYYFCTFCNKAVPPASGVVETTTQAVKLMKTCPLCNNETVEIRNKVKRLPVPNYPKAKDVLDEVYED